MEEKLLSWVKDNTGKIFSSPRKTIFSSQAQDFKIIEVDEGRERVSIQFMGSQRRGRPLTFSMFDRALSFIKKKSGDWARLGTGIKPTYDDTIEAQIWKPPPPIGKSTYKTASHICDILVLAHLAEYGYSTNPKTGRQVQAVRTLEKPENKMPLQTETKRSSEHIATKKMIVKNEIFLKEFKEIIRELAKKPKINIRRVVHVQHLKTGKKSLKK